MESDSPASILPFLEYAHADASPRAFEGLSARYAALAASILAGGRDQDAVAALYEVFEAPLGPHAREKAYWQARSGGGPLEDLQRSLFEAQARLLADPRFARFVEGAARAAEAKAAATAEDSATEDRAFLEALRAFLAEASARDAGIDAAEYAYGGFVAPRLTAAADLARRGERACPRDCADAACHRKAAILRELGSPEVVARALELLRTRAAFAEAAGFPSYAHLRLRDRSFRDPAALSAMLEAEAIAQREEALAGLESAEPAGAVCEKAHLWPQPEPGPAGAPLPVLEAVLAVFGELFDLSFEPRPELPLWDGAVRAYAVRDRDSPEGSDAMRGIIVFDVLEREGKHLGTGMDYLRYPGGRDRGWILYVTSNFKPELDRLGNFAASIGHELGHCLEVLLRGRPRPALVELALPERRESVSALLGNAARLPAFLARLREELEARGEPSFEVGELAARARTSSARSRFLHSRGAMADLAVNMIPTRGLGEEALRDIADRLASLSPLEPCPGAWAEPLRGLAHSNYVCGAYCYVLGDILADRILRPKGEEPGWEALRSTCLRLERELAACPGAFDLGAAFGVRREELAPGR